MRALVLNNKDNMNTLHEIFALDDPMMPETPQQAILLLKTFKYRGTAPRFVPQAIWDRAGIDEYPTLDDDARMVYSSTPVSASKPLVEQMLQQLVIPVDPTTNEARLTTPDARVAIEAVAKAVGIKAGRVDVMQEDPPTIASLQDELNTAHATITALQERKTKWKNEAKAKHEAMILWQTYALAPTNADEDWPEVNTNYDARIQLPPLADAIDDEASYGGNIASDDMYESPLKRRRISYVDTPPSDDED